MPHWELATSIFAVPYFLKPPAPHAPRWHARLPGTQSRTSGRPGRRSPIAPKTVLAVRDHNLRVAMGRMFAELRKLARAEEQHQLRDFCDWIRANAPEHMHGQFVIGVANEPLECRRGYSWPSNLAR